MNSRRISNVFLSLVFVAVAAGCLGGCNSSNTKPIPLMGSGNAAVLSNAKGVSNAFLAPGGNYSLVTMRARPDIVSASSPPDILCTAPSPDWATAVALQQQLSASGGAGGTSASLNANRTSSETISMLAGRTAGVVALRDGLYKACEAYANGIIGKDAYALILSQYGNLLVGVVGSGGSAGSSSSASTTPGPVAVSVSTGSTPAKTTDTPNKPATADSASAMGAALAQAVGAMLVTCISANDPTAHPVNSTPNALLAMTSGSGGATVCSQLLQNIVAAVPTLIKSAQSQTQTGTTSKPKSKGRPAPRPAVH